MHTWKGRQNSYGGRLTLIKSSLSNVSLYMLSLFEVLKGTLKKFDFYRKRLLWQEEEENKKY